MAKTKTVNLLKRYRLAAGLTQTALAKRLGVSQVAVGMWEKGDMRPGPRMYPKLAAIFGVSPLEVTRIVEPETVGV